MRVNGVAAALGLLPLSASHYAMNMPPSWLDRDGTFGMKPGWRGAGCNHEIVKGEENVTGCISQWYSNGTLIPGNATIADDSDLITYQKLCRSKPGSFDKRVCESMRQHPWRAPGTAPVWAVSAAAPFASSNRKPQRSGCTAVWHRRREPRRLPKRLPRKGPVRARGRECQPPSALLRL